MYDDITSDDLAGLSPRSLRHLALGVRGGDGDDPVAPTEPAVTDPPAEVTDPASTDPAPEVTDPADPPVEALVDPIAVVPDVPAELATADDGELRGLYEQLGTLRAERTANPGTDLAARAADMLVVQTIDARRATIREEIVRRHDEHTRIEEGLAGLAEDPNGALPEPVPVFASAAAVVGARGPVQPTVVVQPPAPAVTRPRVAIMASANAGYAVDEPLNMEQLGHGIERGFASSVPGEVRVASIPAFQHMGADERAMLPEMLSNGNSATRNDVLIAEAVEDWRARQAGVEPPARTAAICEPFDIIREIPSAFVATERVSPVFPARPAGRLGYQFTPSMQLSDMEDGSQVWTEDDQAAVDPTDPTTWKPIVDVDCPTAETIHAEAVPFGLRFDNTLEMSLPERIANATAALMAVKSRVKEGRVLQRIDTLSGGYNFTGPYGALPALVEAVVTFLTQATYAERMADPNYVLFLPTRAVTALINIDRQNRAYDPNPPARADFMAQLMEAFGGGVGQIVETLDASLGGEPGLPYAALNPAGHAKIDLPTLDGEYRIRLVDPAAAIYSETGEMYVGTYRSPELIRQNKAVYLGEEYFMLAKHGPQPWAHIDMTLCANGSRAGLLEPYTCADAS